MQLQYSQSLCPPSCSFILATLRLPEKRMLPFVRGARQRFRFALASKRTRNVNHALRFPFTRSLLILLHLRLFLSRAGGITKYLLRTERLLGLAGHIGAKQAFQGWLGWSCRH